MIKKVLKALKFMFLNSFDDIFLILGIIFISIGVFKIYIPAGFIILGICFIAFAFFIAKKGG